MTSVTTWNRIEPRVRDDSLPGTAARIADPLWLLGRQWQLGEFRGQDAGSPAAAQVRASVGQLTRTVTGQPHGSVTGDGYDATAQPLEAVVEREPVLAGGERSLRLAAEAGLVFWRELDAAGLSHRREDYLLDWALARPDADERATMDDAALRLADLLADRVPDGVALRDAILNVQARGGQLPATPRYDEPWERAAALKVLAAFLDW